MRYCLVLGLLATVSLPALAADPKPCADEVRTQCIEYQPNDIVKVTLTIGSTFRFQLAPNEKIEGVLVSDQRTIGQESMEELSQAELAQQQATAPQEGIRQVAFCDPNMCRAVISNFVYLTPRKPLTAQPFFLQGVWTDADGKQRVTPYAFEIQTREQPAREQQVAAIASPTTDAKPQAIPAFYGVRFVYTKRDAEERQKIAAQKAAAWRSAHPPLPKEAIAAAVPIPRSPCETDRGGNPAYFYRGAQDLKPDKVCDDGRTTFLTFNGNRRVPNIYTYLPDGRETDSVGYTSDPGPNGTVIRIAKTDRKFCLRDGDRAGCVINAGGDPQGRTASTVAP
jgi:type IV secretion system protein VirB9